MDHNPNGVPSGLRRIPLSYDHKDSEGSVLKLVYTLQPKWREDDGPVDIIKFTDGITNTLLQIVKRRKGTNKDEQDQDSILMRAYGHNTEILIDRDREATSHALLAEKNLAPPLLARFENGLLYRFISGRPTKPEDLVRAPVWSGVARRLAEWHAKLPIVAIKSEENCVNGTSGLVDGVVSRLGFRQPTPNLWTVMQKWVHALPTASQAEQSRKSTLQDELEKSFEDLDTTSGLGEAGFIFGHCDLLSGNVIVSPQAVDQKSPAFETINFIDYEYATPCPAAFDLANHFAEWGGFDCDYNMLPTKSVRRAFLEDYLQSYVHHLPTSSGKTFDFASTLDELNREVDRYRGMPGLYWGIWALIQATISQIDFDYSNYAEVRLGEYWAWRDSEKAQIEELPLRERRWAQP